MWVRPEVGLTWGCITQNVSPSRGIIVQPQVVPSPPVRGLPSVYITVRRADPSEGEALADHCKSEKRA